MNAMEKSRGPVVIGGIGGSGTRVVAEMLAMMGFFLGNDLNSASDNLTYTLLFKRPEWFRKNAHNTRKIFRGLSILEKSLLTGSPLNLPEKLFLHRAVRDMSIHGHNKEGEGKGEWAYDRLAAIKKPRTPDMTKYAGWGWKEPNSHLMISMMKEYFQGYKYIHTIRHGLDMAFSSNQQQLYNWASLFDVALPGNDADIPRASLKYWIKANQRVCDLVEELGQESVLIINYDALW